MFRKWRLVDAIAAATVGAWLLALVFAPGSLADYYAGFIPARMTGAFSLPHALPAWITPLSATFVHSGLMHLAFNMVFLVFCGRRVEAVLGWQMVGLLYLVGAFVSAGAQFLVDPLSHEPMVGASGAISAVFGVYALLFSQQKVPKISFVPPHVIRALWLGAAWIALQWITGLTMAGEGYRIAIAAHIGGFIIGLVLARPMLAWVYRHA